MRWLSINLKKHLNFPRGLHKSALLWQGFSNWGVLLGKYTVTGASCKAMWRPTLYFRSCCEDLQKIKNLSMKRPIKSVCKCPTSKIAMSPSDKTGNTKQKQPVHCFASQDSPVIDCHQLSRFCWQSHLKLLRGKNPVNTRFL